MFPDVGELVESLVNEDHRNKARKTFLGETRDIAYEETELERDDDQQCHHHPEPDPETKRHKRQIVISTQTAQHCTALWPVCSQWSLALL